MPTLLLHTAERVPLEQIPEFEILAKHVKILCRPSSSRSLGWMPRSMPVVCALSLRLSPPKSRPPKPSSVASVLTIAATVQE